MKRQFFDGGLVIKPSRAADIKLKPRSTSRLSEADINPGQRRVRSADDLKKKQQQSRRPDKEIAVSKVHAQRVKTRAARARGQTLRKRKIETSTQVRGERVQSIVSKPEFKRSLEKITGKKVSAFEGKIETKTLDAEVSKTVNNLKADARAKAEIQASAAKKNLFTRLSDSASAAKKKMSDSIADMKAKFNERFRSTSERFPPEIKNRADIEDARAKTNEHVKKQDEYVSSRKVHEGKADAADVDAHNTRQPRTDGRADTDPGEPLGHPRRRGVKDETPDEIANTKAKKHEADEIVHRDKAAKNESDARRADDDARHIDSEPKDRSPDTDPNRPRDRNAPEQRLKDDVEVARSRVKTHLKNTEGWRASIKRFMGSISSALMLLLPIVLPILLAPPMPRIGPINTGPPFNPGSVFSPNVFPALPTGVAPTYRAYVVQTGKPADIKIPDLSGSQMPTFNDGYMIFTLRDQPEDTVTFQISTDSSSLELETATLTFPIDTWDTPVRVGYSTSLETDLSGNEEYNKLNIKDRYATLRNVSPGGIKNVVYAPESIDTYYPDGEEIDDVDKKLDNLLDHDETYAEALENVYQKVSRRRKYTGGDITPTYDSSDYVPYVVEEIVVPTHDILDYDSVLVDPTYDDESYSIFEPIVEPSIHIDTSYDFYNTDSTNDLIVESTEDDGWDTYMEPISGGEESEPDTNDINAIIESLDYATLAMDIDETKLSDRYKATIQVQAVDSLNYQLSINAVVEDDSKWILKPAELIFDESTNINNMFFFSQNIFNTLVNLHVATETQSIKDNFNNKIEDYETTESDSIDAKYTEDADAVAKEAYDASMAEQQEKIQAGEYVLAQLKEAQSGGTSSYFSRLKNRSRKRKVK